tara:strand:+ start:224 stop:625 length:402 start_codon:yes stop_codon:yes gene_type:complete
MSEEKKRLSAKIKSTSEVEKKGDWVFIYVELEGAEHEAKNYVMFHKEPTELMQFNVGQTIEFEMQSTRDDDIDGKITAPILFNGLDKQKAIISQTCIERAISMVGDEATVDNVLPIAEELFNWVIEKSRTFGK